MGVLDDENSLAAGLFAQGLAGPGSGSGSDSPGARLLDTPAPARPSAVATALVSGGGKTPTKSKNIFSAYAERPGPPLGKSDLAPPPLSDIAAARDYLFRYSDQPGATMRRQGVRTALDRLHPAFAMSLSSAIQDARRAGLPVGVGSAYRPPGYGVGGMRDKSQSMHAYGLSIDVTGIGPPGSKTAKQWYDIATKHGLYNPYWGNPKEWNHYQVVPTKVASQIPGLRDTITDAGPSDLNRMWLASGVPLPGGMAPAAPPSPRARPDTTSLAWGARGARSMPDMGAEAPAMAYAPPADGAGAAPAAKAIQTLVKQPDGAYRPAPAAKAASAAPAGGRVTVGKGDTLWAIAARTLGDGSRWQEIARANGVRNPRSLQPGTVLTIPGAEADVPMPRMRPARPAAAAPRPDMSASANRYGANEPGRGRGLLDQLGTFGPASGPPIPADGRAPPDTRWMDPGMTMTDPSMNADAWQTPPPGLVFGTVPTEGQFNERFAGPADRPVPSMDQFAERFGGAPPPAPAPASADGMPDMNDPAAVQAYIAETRARLEELRRRNSGQPPPSPEAYPSARAGARQPWTEATRARLDELAQRYGQPVYAGPNGVLVFQVQ